MKFSAKLYGGFGVLILLVAAIGLFAIQQMKLLHANTSLLAEGWLPEIVKLGEINDTVQSFRRYELVFILSTEDKDMQAGEELLRQTQARVEKALAGYGATLATDRADARAEFDRLTGMWKRYLAESAKIRKVAWMNRDKAAQMAAGDSETIVRDMMGSVKNLVSLGAEGGERSAAAALGVFTSSRLNLMVCLGVALAAGLALAGVIARNALGQLGEDPGYLRAVAGEIAAGNLDVRFKPVRGTGGVYAVLVQMVATLKDKIAEADAKSHDAARQARVAAEAAERAEEATRRAEAAKAEGMLQAGNTLKGVVAVISSASEELAAQVEQSSRGAEIQAGRVAETAATMEHMNTTVLDVAKSASQAAHTADQAKIKAEEGAAVVVEVMREIEQVEKQATELKTHMAGLGAQVEDIGRVLNVISDIADQTNLLALNAAIEAARAGDAGRGFAVVADEVRKLAEKTMHATKEVGEAIRNIQDGARTNAATVDRTVSLIEEATGHVGKSREALRSIVELVDLSTSQVRSIAQASEEQSTASEAINQAIEDISRISRETSDAMGQSALAVTDLAQQAHALSDLVTELRGERAANPGLRHAHPLPPAAR